MSMNQLPLVSICCLTYNHEQYIDQAIGSFLMQKTNFPIEIIIHDDASTDATAKIIRKYEALHPDLITAIYQEENQYSLGKKMHADYILPKARGKYYAFCEGDDYWIDEYKLQKQADFLKSNPNCSMCFTNFNIVDSDDKLLEKDAWPWYKRRDMDTVYMLKFGVPRTLTVVTRKDILARVVNQNYPKIPYVDQLLFSLITKFGDAKYLDFISANYRHHEGGVWSKIDEIQRSLSMLSTFIGMRKMFRFPEEQEAINVRIRRVHVNIVHNLSLDAQTNDIVLNNDYLNKVYCKYLNVIDRKYVFEETTSFNMEIIRKKNIFIFGASNYASRVYKWLLVNGFVVNKVVDNDEKKWGSYFYDLEIVSPCHIKDIDDVYIFIASRWIENIEKQLNSWGLQRHKHYISFF